MELDTFKKYAKSHHLDPLVYFCGIDENLKPGAKYGPVQRDVFLIECCVSGYGSIEINGTVFPITPRSCYFLFPGDTVTHGTDEHDPRCGYWCAMNGLQIASALKKAGISSSSPFAPSQLFDDINSRLEEMYRTREENDLGADMRRTAHIYAILGSLLRMSTVNVDDKYSSVQKAIGYMEANYHRDMSVALLAGEIGLDRSYFSTLFKSQTGLSPHEYLTQLRVKKAASLLKDSAYSVGEISEAVGFDSGNFSRTFKQVIGMTPLEYRKSITKELSHLGINE